MEIARIEELRLAALEHRIEADLALGRDAEIVGELEGLTVAHPLRERLRGQLMLALYRSGRQAEALASYQTARAALVEELGIEPARRLRELHQAILQQDPGLDVAAPEETAGETSVGVFVGRQRELAELVAGVADAFAGRGRLCLLEGEPGIGKSRLGGEAGRPSAAMQSNQTEASMRRQWLPTGYGASRARARGKAARSVSASHREASPRVAARDSDSAAAMLIYG